MSHQYKARKPEEIYFVTFTIIDWIDIFTRPLYKQIIIDSLDFCCKNKGLNLYAFCLMSNHLHLLVSAKGHYALSDIIRDFKKYTSKKITEAIQNENESRKAWLLNAFSFHASYNKRFQDYKVWQDGYHAVECDSAVILQQKLDYIHHNPVRAHIVAEPQHYLYSSAANYAGEGGLLDVLIAI
nr:transposase [Mucilaginibacter straminoryzae]